MYQGSTSKQSVLNATHAFAALPFVCVLQVRHHLRVVMCFSLVGDAFRDRLRRFPSLITCTTIDWFTVWPNDALASVAQQALADLDVEQGLRNQLAAQCVHFHLTARELTDRWGPGADRQTGAKITGT